MERKGLNEKGILKGTKKVLVEIDSKYYRPSEVNNLLGDPSKAKKFLAESIQNFFSKTYTKNDGFRHEVS